MTGPGASMQVERVLDDLIQRLTDREKTAAVRAALIEARRLKNVTTRWAAIPPPPDARREMLTRVMELVSSVGSPITVSTPPPPRGQPSPPPARRSAPGPAPDSRRAMAHAPTEASMPPVAVSTPPGGALSSPQPKDPRKRTTGDFAFPPKRPATSSRPGSLGSDDFDTSLPPRAETLPAFDSSNPEPKPPSSRKSSFPTAPPPPPAGALYARPPSSGRNATSTSGPASPRTTGGFGEGRGRTLAQGSLDINDALDALTGAKRPALPRIDEPATEGELGASRRADTRELPLFDPSKSNSPPTPSAPAVRAIPSTGEGRSVEGFSKKLSMAGIPAVRATPVKVPTIGPTGATGRPASNPTQTLFGAGIKQALREASTPTPPPASVRQPGSVPPGMRTLVAPGVTIVRPDAVEWQSHPTCPGVTMKTLYRDPRAGIFTALMRLAPGAELPRRRHASPEELFLVAGTAQVGDHEMHAGEYARAESETVTEPIRTPNGCTFFVCGSENDELLESS